MSVTCRENQAVKLLSPDNSQAKWHPASLCPELGVVPFVMWVAMSSAGCYGNVCDAGTVGCGTAGPAQHSGAMAGPNTETRPCAGPREASASHQEGLNPRLCAVLALLRAQEALVGPSESSQAMVAVLLLLLALPQHFQGRPRADQLGAEAHTMDPSQRSKTGRTPIEVQGEHGPQLPQVGRAQLLRSNAAVGTVCVSREGAVFPPVKRPVHLHHSSPYQGH